MNKHQKLISRIFKIHFPLAIKNGQVLESERKYRYKRFKWVYSDDTIEQLKEELDSYQRMRDASKNKVKSNKYLLANSKFIGK